MKFMLNGALTIGTMDGANVEMAEEVGEENMFIFGMSAEEVMAYEANGGYNPYDIYNSDGDLRKVLEQLVDGTYSKEGDLFNEIYTSLLKGTGYDRPDVYFNLKDFRSYAQAQARVNKAYKDRNNWGENGNFKYCQCRQVFIR